MAALRLLALLAVVTAVAEPPGAAGPGQPLLLPLAEAGRAGERPMMRLQQHAPCTGVSVPQQAPRVADERGCAGQPNAFRTPRKPPPTTRLDPSPHTTPASFK